MPAKYIAFLRAINVGGHTVKMDALRRLFEGLGLVKVETFIASGNVIFESTTKNIPALAQKIEAHLQAALGYPVATFIRTPAELAAIVLYQPFTASVPNAQAHSLYIGFLANQPAEAAHQKLMTFASDIDHFHIQGREVYWLCQKTMGQSEFSGARLEKALGLPATLRNVTTVKKLAAKYS